MIKRILSAIKYLFTGKFPMKEDTYTKAEWEQYQKDKAMNGQLREDGSSRITLQPTRFHIK